MGEDSKFNNTILTNIGHQMLTSIASGNRKITYTKAEAYTQDVSSIANETLQALTSLQGKELSTNLLVSNDNGNVVTITANFENKGLTSDAVFNSVGWFAKLDTDDAEHGIMANQEYLIGITPANGAQTLVAPPADQSASQAISLNLNMTLSDAANVNMTVSDAGTVHFNQLDDQLAEYTTTSDLTKLLAGKADLGLSYTKAELDAKLLNLTADTNGKVSADQVQALISDKANISDVYTKSQIDSDLSTRDAQINAKANASDVYTKSQIDSDFSARDTKINTKANTSDVYTKSDVNNALAADRGRLGKLEGAQTVDSPDFNSITNTGVYYITNNTSANIKNNPVSQWGVLVVSSGNGQRISQVYYPDDGSPQWCRLLNGGNWLPWYQLSTKKDVSNAADLANQAQTTANTKANSADVYTKNEIDGKLTTVGAVKTVDKIQPDSSGNVDIQPEFNSLLGRNNLLTDDEMDISKATKSTAAQKAISNAKYANGINTFHYCGVTDYERVNWKIAVQPNTNYELNIIANSTNQLTPLDPTNEPYIPFNANSSADLTDASNGDLGTCHLMLPWQGIETAKMLFNSKNYSEIYITCNFGFATDGVNTDITLQTTLLKSDPIQNQIDNLQNQTSTKANSSDVSALQNAVNNIDSTRTPIVVGAKGDDLFSFKTNQIRLYNSIGNTCKNLPSASNTQWFTVQYVFETPNNDGIAIYRSPDNEIWTAGCHSSNYDTGWTRVANATDITNLQNTIQADKTANKTDVSNLANRVTALETQKPIKADSQADAVAKSKNSNNEYYW